uniref:Uncharacterized protein n=1 Tax=Rhizophora mucronata TaxID=61149 RepID=A0A2P2QJE6_RHIMU
MQKTFAKILIETQIYYMQAQRFPKY